jgi:hypothetical protein
MSEPDRKTWRDEPVRTVMSFIGASLLTLFAFTSILVGATTIEPCPALLMALAPAAFLGVLAARTTATRRFFSRWYMN